MGSRYPSETIIPYFSGTKSYMPPEYYKSKQYDGCQGTVWQMGILLVDMLSPVFNAFEHIRDAFTKPPYVPSDLSSGISFLFLPSGLSLDGSYTVLKNSASTSVVGRMTEKLERVNLS